MSTMASRIQIQERIDRLDRDLIQPLERLIYHRPLADVWPALIAEHNRLTGIMARYIDEYNAAGKE